MFQDFKKEKWIKMIIELCLFFSCFFSVYFTCSEEMIDSLLMELDNVKVETSRQKARPAYKLGIGDIIEITVWGVPVLSKILPIRPDGRISYPLVGEIVVEGMTVEELESYLEEKLVDWVFEPKVCVIVTKFREELVYITGEIAEPGAYPISENNNALMKMLALAKWKPSIEGSERIIVLRGKNVFTIDPYTLETSRQLNDFVLQKDDVIYVTRKGYNKVAIMGEVNKTGVYDYYPGMDLRELIALAGGEKPSANLNVVEIVRDVGGNKQRIKIGDALKKTEVEPIKLAPKDIVYVGSSEVSEWWREFVSLIRDYSTIRYFFKQGE